MITVPLEVVYWKWNNNIIYSEINLPTFSIRTFTLSPCTIPIESLYHWINSNMSAWVRAFNWPTLSGKIPPADIIVGTVPIAAAGTITCGSATWAGTSPARLCTPALFKSGSAYVPYEIRKQIHTSFKMGDSKLALSFASRKSSFFFLARRLSKRAFVVAIESFTVFVKPFIESCSTIAQAGAPTRG